LAALKLGFIPVFEMQVQTVAQREAEREVMNRERKEREQVTGERHIGLVQERWS